MNWNHACRGCDLTFASWERGSQAAAAHADCMRQAQIRGPSSRSDTCLALLSQRLNAQQHEADGQALFILRVRGLSGDGESGSAAPRERAGPQLRAVSPYGPPATSTAPSRTTRVMAAMVRATPPMKLASPATWATSMGSALGTTVAARLAGATRRAALRIRSDRSLRDVARRGAQSGPANSGPSGMGGLRLHSPAAALIGTPAPTRVTHRIAGLGTAGRTGRAPLLTARAAARELQVLASCERAIASGLSDNVAVRCSVGVLRVRQAARRRPDAGSTPIGLPAISSPRTQVRGGDPAKLQTQCKRLGRCWRSLGVLPPALRVLTGEARCARRARPPRGPSNISLSGPGAAKASYTTASRAGSLPGRRVRCVSALELVLDKVKRVEVLGQSPRPELLHGCRSSRAGRCGATSA